MKLQKDKFIIDITILDTANCAFNDDYIVCFRENAEYEFSKTRIVSIDSGDNGFVTVAKYKNGELQPIGQKHPNWLNELIEKMS